MKEILPLVEGNEGILVQLWALLTSRAQEYPIQTVFVGIMSIYVAIMTAYARLSPEVKREENIDEN